MPDVKERRRTSSVDHDANGKFKKGNRAGVDRSQPVYDRNLSKDIRRILAEHGGDGDSWSVKIVKAMAKEAAGGNVKAAEWLGDRAEGKAIQRLDVDIRQRSLVLAQAYGLDPEEVARMAQEIADADATPLDELPEGSGETVSEGGPPGQRNREDVDVHQQSDPTE